MCKSLWLLPPREKSPTVAACPRLDVLTDQARGAGYLFIPWFIRNSMASGRPTRPLTPFSREIASRLSPSCRCQLWLILIIVLVALYRYHRRGHHQPGEIDRQAQISIRSMVHVLYNVFALEPD